MMTKVTAPTQSELQALRDQGASRADMAAHYGVSLSRVKRWISELDVQPRPLKSKPAPSQREKPTTILPLESGLSLMERCKQILGARMSEDHRGYLLDGRPASSSQILRAAGVQDKRTAVSFA